MQDKLLLLNAGLTPTGVVGPLPNSNGIFPAC